MARSVRKNKKTAERKRRNSAVAELHAFRASSSFLTGRRFTLDVRTLVETGDEEFSDIISGISKIIEAGEKGHRIA